MLPETPAPANKFRRTWPQRFLMLAGLGLAAVCFLAAWGFWQARTLLADLPRIPVGADLLAQSGEPGEPVNFLLVGVDSSEGLDPDDPVRRGRDVVAEANGRFLSDTILLLRLDPATGNAAVLSIPRDLYVDVPGSSKWKINSTLLIGGMDKLIETIGANLSIPVNHFVVVDFAGFADLVELVGGVPVYFPYPTRDLGSGLFIEQPGCWVLNGDESLGYVRARTLEEQIDGEWIRLAAPAPDLARIERQQEFMVLALEEALRLGGTDLARVGQFVEVGSQAVQLDENLTPRDLLDLASAFAEYDTESLRVTTLPVSALFTDEGQYLGEQLQLADATEVLEVFQGLADGVRPAEVTLIIRSADDGRRDRASQQLDERGFELASIAEQGSGESTLATTLTFAPELSAEASILARYLSVVPRFVVGEPGTMIVLDVGPDFAGVRQFPRAASEVRPAIVQALANVPARQAGSPPVAPPSTAPGSPDVSDGPTTAPAPTTTIERGRPPANVRCSPTSGG